MSIDKIFKIYLKFITCASTNTAFSRISVYIMCVCVYMCKVVVGCRWFCQELWFTGSFSLDSRLCLCPTQRRLTAMSGLLLATMQWTFCRPCSSLRVVYARLSTSLHRHVTLRHVPLPCSLLLWSTACHSSRRHCETVQPLPLTGFCQAVVGPRQRTLNNRVYRWWQLIADALCQDRCQRSRHSEGSYSLCYIIYIQCCFIVLPYCLFTAIVAFVHSVQMNELMNNNF